MRIALATLALAGCLLKPPKPDDGGVGRLVAGDRHACMLDAADELWCWGDNEAQQLGRTTPGYTGTPMLVDHGPWTSIAAGIDHTCGVRDGAVFCWGGNASGQASPMVGDREVAITEVALPTTARIARVFAGGTATCAVDDLGALFCWGRIEPGNEVPPRQLHPGGLDETWDSVAISLAHACALATSGTVACWGYNGSLQLGTADSSATLASDDAVTVAQTFRQIAVGPNVSCGITLGENSLYCWGESVITQTDAGTTGTVVDSKQWSQIAIGDGFACAVRDGEVYCYGSNYNGALGRGTLEYSPNDRMFATRALDNVAEVVTGASFSCARTSTSTASCWGANVFGELGNGEVATQRDPVPIALPGVTALALGDGHTCALTDQQQAFCWGRDYEGQVSKMRGSMIASPSQLAGNFLSLAVGEFHSCGLGASNARLECWGLDSPQQRLDSAGVALATSLASASQWNEIAAGGNTTCALANTGQIKCWGDLGGLTGSGGWTHVALGYRFGVRVQPGTAYNEWGTECSVGTHPFDPPGTARTTGLNIGTIAPGDGHVCAIEDASVYCWGLADDGQTGTPTEACATPRLVDNPNSLSWRKLAAGGQHTCGIDDQMNLFCWGLNTRYALTSDIGSATALPLPAGGSRKWNLIATGRAHSCGVAIDGQLYCWGENRYGEVGNGFSFRPSPVAVAFP